MNWIDLSQYFYEGMPQSGRFAPARVARHHEEREYPDGRDTFTYSELAFATHVGTHVDAPFHYFARGKTIDQFPLEKFVGSALVVAVPKAPLEAVTLKDLEPVLHEVRAGDFVFFHTGWGEKFGTEAYHQHPYLDMDVAAWLVDREVSMVGVDTITPDIPGVLRKGAYTAPIHRALLRREILIIEHLNLAAVSGRRLEVHAFPVKVKGADGAPARVVGRV